MDYCSSLPARREKLSKKLKKTNNKNTISITIVQGLIKLMPTIRITMQTFIFRHYRYPNL